MSTAQHEDRTDEPVKPGAHGSTAVTEHDPAAIAPERSSGPTTMGEPEPDTESPAARPSTWRGHWARAWPELIGAGVAAVLALLGAAAALRLWKASLNVPITAGGDGLLTLLIVKGMQDNGWYQFNPYLGYPFGQDFAAYPATVGDLWHMVTLKVLSLFLTPAGAVNAFFIGGFAVIAVVAYFALRYLSVSRTLSCALGVVYALAPYHFLRGESHLLLSAYYGLPIAVVLAVSLYTGRSRLLASPRHWGWAGWGSIAAAVLLAGTGLYYAVFAVVIIAAAGILGAIAYRRLAPFVAAVGLSVVVVAGLGLAALPNLLFRSEVGSEFAVDGRSYGATEFYGLKIVNLVLPWGLHRIQALADLRLATADTPIPGEGSETLGILGVVGLIILVVVALLPRTRAHRLAFADRVHPLGALTIVVILCATVAGLNSVLAALGFAELRAWNRISILIAFLALAGLGLGLDALLRRVHWRGPRFEAVAAVGVAGAIALVAVYDQTSDALIPNYPGSAASWQHDAAYFAAVEDELDAGTPVFQLPYVPFPENPPVVDMADYSHLRGYIHSGLKWSYGGVKGQKSEWQTVALADGITAALPRIVSAGFDAIYVNRLGYVDRGAQVEAEILAEIGPQTPLVSADQLLVTYDLRPYAARLRAAGALPTTDSVIYPARLEYGEGTYAPEGTATDSWRWAQAQGQVAAINPSTRETRVRLTGEVRVATPGAAVTIEVGGRTVELTADAGGAAPVDVVFSVPAEDDQAVTVTTDSAPTVPSTGDLRDLRQQLLNFRLVPVAG